MIPIAACLVLVLAVIVPFLNRGGGELELKLSEGVWVSYVNKPLTGAGRLDLMPLTEDELFSTHIFGYEIAVFEGTVTGVRNIVYDLGGSANYRAIATIETGEVLRGPLGKGETVTLLLPGPVGSASWVEDTGISSQVTKGTRGIFMPIKYDETAVYEEGGQRLVLLDLADYGLTDGERWLFIEKGEGLIYFEDAYPSLAGAEDLGDVKKIIRSRIMTK
ncbi:MAG: hypothetical protein GX973_07450 [Firmicutes bacterium]|nr:hypothetical protein [Bacillota bacterium]